MYYRLFDRSMSLWIINEFLNGIWNFFWQDKMGIPEENPTDVDTRIQTWISWLWFSNDLQFSWLKKSFSLIVIRF